MLFKDKCLNFFIHFSQRALLLWLNSLVSNDPLLKRYYCEGAFIRQCRSALQGLYADLTTHIEQLLNYPFSFDLAAEAKRPIGYTPPGSTHHGAKNDSTNANKTISSNATRKTGQEFKEVRTVSPSFFCSPLPFGDYNLIFPSPF